MEILYINMYSKDAKQLTILGNGFSRSSKDSVNCMRTILYTGTWNLKIYSSCTTTTMLKAKSKANLLSKFVISAGQPNLKLTTEKQCVAPKNKSAPKSSHVVHRTWVLIFGLSVYLLMNCWKARNHLKNPRLFEPRRRWNKWCSLNARPPTPRCNSSYLLVYSSTLRKDPHPVNS